MSIDNNNNKEVEIKNETRFLIQVSENIPTLQQCHDFVASDPLCGAVATFTGITRNNYQGKIVHKLSYEGYIPMAIKELNKLCNDAIIKYPDVHKIAIVHIVGDCPVGTISVIICCSSPHRKESIHCTEYLIDTLKATIPIWKLEVYEGDNNSVWKENLEWHEGKQRRIMIQQEQTTPSTTTTE